MIRTSFAAVLSTLTLSGFLVAGCSTADDDYSDSGSLGSSGSANTSGSSGSSGTSGSSGSKKDPLAYPQVEYKYTCSATGTTNSIPISDGPCSSQQKAFARTVACNEVDANGTFNSVGRPYYQCLVNNSDGDQKKYYQQHLDFYSR